MTTAVNSKGVTHAKSLISSGNVSTGAWSLSADEENAWLGPNGNDWAEYASWYLATHPSETANTKAYYGYPFGKGGKVYRNAVIAAKGRATQQGATAVATVADTLLNLIDKKGMESMPVKTRAYARFELKSFDESTGEFAGIASTPNTDRMGDVVEPLGAKFTLPLSLLYQHRSTQPIGLITWAKATKTGIEVKGRVMKELLNIPWIQEAWTLISATLIRGLSIGFLPLTSEPINAKDPFGPARFLTWDWMELSAVTIPANMEATIQTIKSFDERQRAASGTVLQRVVRLNASPGVTGQSFSTKGVEAMGTKTLAEQIAGFEAKRASLLADNEAVMAKAGDEGRTLEPDEKETYDGNAAEIKTVSEHLDRLRAHEKAMLENAVPIVSQAGATENAGTQTRSAVSSSGVIYGMKSRLEPGVRFARYAMCIGASKGNLMQAELIAAQRFKDTPEVAMALKTAVSAGTTQDATWASPLVQLQEMQAEFIDFVRPLTLLGRIPNLRRVPFNIKFTRQTAGTSGSFVGEGLPKPLGKMSFELLSLTWAKAATIIVMTEELLRFSNPNAEILARDDLAAGISQYLDKRFIDPVYAGVSNVSPASITNGITPIASLGTSIANITDTAALALNAMITADLDPSRFVWIMNPAIALDLSLKRTTQDVFAFPGITALGGTFLGYPVVTSNNVVLSGSPTESFVVLVDPTNIMVADDGGVQIDMSTEASLQMDDSPSAGAQSMVSLWQSNMIGLRAERFINWRRRRETAVGVITMNVKW